MARPRRARRGKNEKNMEGMSMPGRRWRVIFFGVTEVRGQRLPSTRRAVTLSCLASALQSWLQRCDQDVQSEEFQFGGREMEVAYGGLCRVRFKPLCERHQCPLAKPHGRDCGLASRKSGGGFQYRSSPVLVASGADMVRVHDVAEMSQAVKMADAVYQ